MDRFRARLGATTLAPPGFGADARTPIIIDPGTHTSRVGFSPFSEPHHAKVPEAAEAHPLSPSVTFPTVVGRRRNPHWSDMDKRDAYVGQVAIEKGLTLNIKRPYNHACPLNFNDADKLWHECFWNEMTGVAKMKAEDPKWSPELCPAVMTISPAIRDVGRSERCRLVAALFEGFEVPALAVCGTARMGLIGSGRLSGVAVDLGYDETTVTSVVDGNVVDLKVLGYGGKAIDTKLRRAVCGSSEFDLNDQAMHFGEFSPTLMSHEREVERRRCALLCEMKERLCYVRPAGEKPAESYLLPDGKAFSVDAAVATGAPEILFNPALFPSARGPMTGADFRSDVGVQELVRKVIAKCSDDDARLRLQKNVLLFGGTSRLSGMCERMQSELTKTHSVSLAASPHMSWIGAALLPMVPSFSSHWITRYQYEEFGASVASDCLGLSEEDTRWIRATYPEETRDCDADGRKRKAEEDERLRFVGATTAVPAAEIRMEGGAKISGVFPGMTGGL